MDARTELMARKLMELYRKWMESQPKPSENPAKG